MAGGGIETINSMTGEDRDGIEGILLANRLRLIRFLEAQGAGDAAEDLFQELWMKLSARPTGPVAQPLSYLYRAASNLMLDRYRAQRQALQRDRAWSEATGRESDDRPSAEHSLILREQLARADAALAALGPRVATCFRRFRLDGIEQKAIAAELGVSLSTVESDLRRAYAALVALRRQWDEA
jgi:RNA polymerase sigma-70 factor (ECF subfamily)